MVPQVDDPTRESLAWIETAKLRTLRRNPQYLTEKQMEALERSIRRDGFLAPILVRPMGNNYEIVSGNHRFLAGRNAGLERFPCIIVSMTDDETRRAVINLNTIHGAPEAAQLAPFLAEMDDALLATVHLDEQLYASIVEFDAELVKRLRELEAPKSIATAVHPGTLLGDCRCPTCGKRHIRQAESTS